MFLRCNRFFIYLKFPTPNYNRLLGTEYDKSFVDDFDMERGIVSMRVGLSYDLLRLSLCSGDLLYIINLIIIYYYLIVIILF